jgi:hypothetical protein
LLRLSGAPLSLSGGLISAASGKLGHSSPLHVQSGSEINDPARRQAVGGIQQPDDHDDEKSTTAWTATNSRTDAVVLS